MSVYLIDEYVRSSSHEQSVPTCMNKPVNNHARVCQHNHVQADQLNHIQVVASSTIFKLWPLAQPYSSRGQLNHIQACQLAKTTCVFSCVHDNDIFSIMTSGLIQDNPWRFPPNQDLGKIIHIHKYRDYFEG